MTLRVLLRIGGLALFAFAFGLSFGWFGDAGITSILGVIAAGLACWIAATLP